MIWIYIRNTRINAAGVLDEHIADAGVPPRGYQVPPLEEDVSDDQAPLNPPYLMNSAIRAAFKKNIPKPLQLKRKWSRLKRCTSDMEDFQESFSW